MADTSWVRHREGMGVWEHRGKVAIVGWGQSHMDRRWDGVTMDRSCGGLSKEACLKAIADAGLSLDDIDGLITSAETRAGSDAPRAAASWWCRGPSRTGAPCSRSPAARASSPAAPAAPR